MNNHYYYENDENKKSSSIFPYLVTAGLGVLSWKLYSNPIFRRDFIQGCFNTYDYIYDKYYNLRYDDKVTRISLLKKEVSQKQQKLIDFLYSNSDDSSVIPDSETDSDASHTSSVVSLLDTSHKYTLIEFFSNELKFESVSYKEKKYYILGTKENNNVHKDINDKIIEFPWLAASLDITCVDNTSVTYEITDKFKTFWIEHNQLPLHIEYYDIWISELISDKQSYPSKENIKEIALKVIDQKGDFIEYSDVLIEPHRDETKIINIPSLNQNKSDQVKEVTPVEQVTQVEEVTPVEEEVTPIEEVTPVEEEVTPIEEEVTQVEEVKPVEEEVTQVEEEVTQVEEVNPVEEVKPYEEVNSEEVEESEYDYRYVPYV